MADTLAFLLLRSAKRVKDEWASDRSTLDMIVQRDRPRGLPKPQTGAKRDGEHEWKCEHDTNGAACHPDGMPH
jgi:hypothetical protein